MGMNANDTRNKLKFFTDVKRNLTGHCRSCSPEVYDIKPANLLGECRKFGGI